MKKTYHNSERYCFLTLMVLIFLSAQSQSQTDRYNAIANDTVTTSYLMEHLSTEGPKLILTSSLEQQIKKKLTSDPLVHNYANYLRSEALEIVKKPLLKRELEGFRLLFVSREFLRRMTILCIVYRLDKDATILRRIDVELQAVCSFKDWNPKHFLDVAEMCLGVAIAVDWIGRELSHQTLDLAKKSLIEKGIKPSYNTEGKRMFWIDGSNNWNSVCHGGLIAASIAIAEMDPTLAAKTINRALQKMPTALKEYAPDGVYPEGPSYWGYGTSYVVVASNALTTALGHDFGMAEHPGFMESVNFRLLATSPSGDLFNFADSGDKNTGSGSLLMSWFAAKTGDGLYFDKSFFEKPEDGGRFAGFGLIWLSQFEEETVSTLPLTWRGRGTNPVAIFRSDKDDPTQFYLGMKGGKARLSHGNMDAGTFVFDLFGVRWVLDPGNQRYYLLNKIGFQLSNHNQDSERWTLLTKSNHGHSSITVNDARYNVDGFAPIHDFNSGEIPQVAIDMTDVLGGNVDFLERRFIKESSQSVIIVDSFVANSTTQNITWALMTTAEIEIRKHGALLKQDGKELSLSIIKPAHLSISVINLDPPPLAIDKVIENLKRIEIRFPAYLAEDQKGVIKVRLSGDTSF
ncbi:MAG: hypothetical protein HKN87_14625 [Saprospiraceae bacterium]|nr:hypothetical protein [Saprospiraceae bacterium]